MHKSAFQTSARSTTLAGRSDSLLGSIGLLVLLLCFASTVHAAEPVPQVTSIAPKVYDLNSRHGVLAVYQRVQTIAEQHCVANTDLAQPLNAAERSCRDRVLAQLLGKLADPYLSYLHENPEAQRLAER